MFFPLPKDVRGSSWSIFRSDRVPPSSIYRPVPFHFSVGSITLVCCGEVSTSIVNTMD